MNKIRQWDNFTAKWLMRHFYVLFFQIVLVFIFIIWFINLFNVLDTSTQVSKLDVTERILASQSINSTIMVFLLLLNSFWMLFVFNNIQRLKTIVKDISYHISRMRSFK